MKHRSLICLVGLAIAALAPSFASATPEPGAQAASPAVAAEPVPAPTTPTRKNVQRSIKIHEPMTTPMAKPGMMKKDMTRGLAQRESEMKDMIDKEEKEMK